MFKSIFSKQFFISISILFFSFIILAVNLNSIFKNYFMKKQYELLTDQGIKISTLFEELAKESYYKESVGRIIVYRELSNKISDLHEYLNSSCFFVDKDFRVLGCSKDMNYLYDIKLDVSVIPEINNLIFGYPIYTEGYLGGYLNNRMIIVGYPLNVMGEVVGYIFMVSSMLEFNETIYDIKKMIIFCMMISIIIAFLLIYIYTKNITKNLKKMNDIAKIISNGNFEKRIIINTQDEIGQLAVSFNEMAESLNKQEIVRKEFISNISHDIRSPLTSIKGFLEAMIDGTIPSDKYNYYLNIILDECSRLTKLTNDMLDINKIEFMCEVNINKEIFDINELIRKTLIKFENKIQQMNIDMNISFYNEVNLVVGDYEKIERVVYNLIDNAIKFTEKRKEIKIETWINDDKIYISIKDRGRGISEKDQKRIFERFYKVDSSRGEDKLGYGLGLAIVKEFIKAHDEKIIVNSEEGIGSEFIFTLSIYK